MMYSSQTNLHGCPKWVKRRGFRYELTVSNGKHCIYSQTDEESDQIIGYEVFRIKFQKERVVEGKVLKSRFQFPHDEAFGEWAWFTASLSSAVIIIARLK